MQQRQQRDTDGSDQHCHGEQLLARQQLQGGRCLCGLGDSAGWVIDSTFRHFREEYEDHALRHTCNVGKALAHA